jgi:hypothetical protein
MVMQNVSMKRNLISGKSLVALATVLVGVLVGSHAPAQSQTNRIRVGVYDSRAVAVAWANSTEFAEVMKATEAEFAKAKEAKDEKRQKEINARMQRCQVRAHEQAFSTGSVASILARVKDRLPTLAQQAGVQVIVSKWELNHQSAAVETIDVTDRLVALFHVSERGLKWCRDIQKKPPLPMDEITDAMD